MGHEAHHIDLVNEDTGLSLAATSIMVGAWRNNSELEAIPVGAYKRRGQPKTASKIGKCSSAASPPPN